MKMLPGILGLKTPVDYLSATLINYACGYFLCSMFVQLNIEIFH